MVDAAAEDDAERAHGLVEDAFELAEQKLEQNEVTVDDIEDVYDALDEACSHEASDIWVTITALGPKNQCAPHLREDEPEWLESPRQTLENIVSHEIEVTVS